jgi:type IV pilus assembly protein PilO
VSKRISETDEKLKKINVDITKAKDIKAKYNDLTRTLSDLTNQKSDMEKKLPRDRNMPDLMKIVKQIADRYSIQIMSISPATAVKEQYFFRITYNISATGSYHDIGKFFAEIAMQERILNVENLILSEGDSSAFSFVLVSYQYDEGKK